MLYKSKEEANNVDNFVEHEGIIYDGSGYI